MAEDGAVEEGGEGVGDGVAKEVEDFVEGGGVGGWWCIGLGLGKSGGGEDWLVQFLDALRLEGYSCHVENIRMVERSRSSQRKRWNENAFRCCRRYVQNISGGELTLKEAK